MVSDSSICIYMCVACPFSDQTCFWHSRWSKHNKPHQMLTIFLKKHMNWTRFKRQIPICVCFLCVSLSHYLLFRCLAEFWCFEHFGATFIHLGCGMFHIIRNICSHLSQFFVCCWLDSRCFALHIVHFLLFDSLTQQ